VRVREGSGLSRDGVHPIAVRLIHNQVMIWKLGVTKVTKVDVSLRSFILKNRYKVINFRHVSSL